MTENQTVLVELLIAAPVDDVWRALRDPEQIARWFGWKYPTLKEEIDYIFFHDTGTVADESTHTIRFSETGDVFSLEPMGDRTIIRLTRAARADGSWDDIYDDIIEGWTTFLQQLRFTLERHAADERRTLYVSGRARAAGDPNQVEALGFGSMTTARVGEAYALTAPTGDRLKGTVWFRSKHQVGVTVDALGDGLLVVARRPPTEKSPHGGGMIVLSAYQLTETEFEAWVARWHLWWSGAYELTDAHPAPVATSAP